MTDILVVNTGSSSIKVAVFDPALKERLKATATEIGGANAHLMVGDRGRDTPLADHEAALSAILEALPNHGIDVQKLAAAAHRVVHGGRCLTEPSLLTDDVLKKIKACIPIAPLHNPHNLAAIQALKSLTPDLMQYASFDTGFHASNPEIALRYAIPSPYDQRGIRRYGFHGTSYAAMVTAFGKDLPGRLLAFHLGNGTSACAILGGKSVATNMGYSPLEGLTMGTRCGSIDGAAVLRLAEEEGIDATMTLLNQESGLKGLAGTHDMVQLLLRQDETARFAIDHFCYWAARHAGSLVVAMGGADAIAFTGGIGENASLIREKITDHLSFLGDVPVHVVKAEEEKQLARDALRLMQGSNEQ